MSKAEPKELNNSLKAARDFGGNPDYVSNYTIFNPKNVYRSAKDVFALHQATGDDVAPRGNATKPGDIVGVSLISFRPERIAEQMTLASVNMQARVNEGNFHETVKSVFDEYVLGRMQSVIPQVDQIRDEIEDSVSGALKKLSRDSAVDASENETLKIVKEAREKVVKNSKIQDPEFIDKMTSQYATDLIYNSSPKIFEAIEEAVSEGMKEAEEAVAFQPLTTYENANRVALVVAGGPASGKTKAAEMARDSMPDPADVMSLSTDQLRPLLSSGGDGKPELTDLEANLVFRQVIGKLDNAMQNDVAPTVLSEATSLNPDAIDHLLKGGAEVRASLISIPVEVALERAEVRSGSDNAADKGRTYSDEYLRELHQKDGGALSNISERCAGKNVTLSVFNNNVPWGEAPELVGVLDLEKKKMTVYDKKKLIQLEQKGKINTGSGPIYRPEDSLPENNMEFLNKAAEIFEVTYEDQNKDPSKSSAKPENNAEPDLKGAVSEAMTALKEAGLTGMSDASGNPQAFSGGAAEIKQDKGNESPTR